MAAVRLELPVSYYFYEWLKVRITKSEIVRRKVIDRMLIVSVVISLKAQRRFCSVSSVDNRSVK